MADSVASAPQGSTPTKAAATVKTCDNCRRRKVKCDRTQPCSRCRDSGVPCISSKISNLPRGRNGGRRKANIELNARVAKLENLLSQVAEMAETSMSTQLRKDEGIVWNSIRESENFADASRQ